MVHSSLRLPAFGILLAATLSNAAAASDQRSAGTIWPTRMTLTDANGQSYFTVPYRFYFEYGHGTAKSKSSPNVVDIRRNSYTFGIDFIAADFWLWGAAIQYSKLHDGGSAPFVPSIVTDKNITGGSAYIARYVLPHVIAGVNVSYNAADGRAVYNGADTVTEDSNTRTIRAFISRDQRLTRYLILTYGASIERGESKFTYQSNIPPTGQTSHVIARLPVTLGYSVTQNFMVSVQAQFNQYLSLHTFPNVPSPDRSTVTLVGGASFSLNNRVTMYGNVAHDVFDTTYNSTRVNFGVSVPFSVFATGPAAAKK